MSTGMCDLWSFRGARVQVFLGAVLRISPFAANECQGKKYISVASLAISSGEGKFDNNLSFASSENNAIISGQSCKLLVHKYGWN